MTTLIKKEQLAVLNKVDFAQQSHPALVTYYEDMHFTNDILYERHYLNTENSLLSSSNFLPWQQLQAVNEPVFVPDTIRSVIETPAMTCGPKNEANIRKKREKGAGRKQVLTMDKVIPLMAHVCSDCGSNFTDHDHRCYHAFYQLELECRAGDESEYIVVQTKYKLYDSHCQHCGAITQTTLLRIKTSIEGVMMPGQRFVGPRLASELIGFHKYDDMSIRKLKRCAPWRAESEGA